MAAANDPVALPESVRQIVGRLAELPDVRAIALAGSQTGGVADPLSDFDAYVYHDGPVPIAPRQALARDFADDTAAIEIDNRFWGPGDEWIDRESGHKIDLIYFPADWMEDQVRRVLIRHEASVGYSTCFWATVRRSQPLFDREGWLARLQALADQPYPEALRRAILAMNYPILRANHAAYTHQIEWAVARRDRVSLNHRIAGLLASYFDILFAANRVPHPGEKRLIQQAQKLCPALPDRLPEQVEAVLVSVSSPWDAPASLPAIHALLDNLDAFLAAEGLDLATL